LSTQKRIKTLTTAKTNIQFKLSYALIKLSITVVIIHTLFIVIIKKLAILYYCIDKWQCFKNENKLAWNSEI